MRVRGIRLTKPGRVRCYWGLVGRVGSLLLVLLVLLVIRIGLCANKRGIAVRSSAYCVSVGVSIVLALCTCVIISLLCWTVVIGRVLVFLLERSPVPGTVCLGFPTLVARCITNGVVPGFPLLFNRKVTAPAAFPKNVKGDSFTFLPSPFHFCTRGLHKKSVGDLQKILISFILNVISQRLAIIFFCTGI